MVWTGGIPSPRSLSPAVRASGSAVHRAPSSAPGSTDNKYRKHIFQSREEETRNKFRANIFLYPIFRIVFLFKFLFLLPKLYFTSFICLSFTFLNTTWAWLCLWFTSLIIASRKCTLQNHMYIRDYWIQSRTYNKYNAPIISRWIMNLLQLYSNWGAYGVHRLQIFSFEKGILGEWWLKYTNKEKFLKYKTRLHKQSNFNIYLQT